MPENTTAGVAGNTETKNGEEKETMQQKIDTYRKRMYIFLKTNGWEQKTTGVFTHKQVVVVDGKDMELSGHDVVNFNPSTSHPGTHQLGRVYLMTVDDNPIFDRQMFGRFATEFIMEAQTEAARLGIKGAPLPGEMGDKEKEKAAENAKRAAELEAERKKRLDEQIERAKKMKADTDARTAKEEAKPKQEKPAKPKEQPKPKEQTAPTAPAPAPTPAPAPKEVPKEQPKPAPAPAPAPARESEPVKPVAGGPVLHKPGDSVGAPVHSAPEQHGGHVPEKPEPAVSTLPIKVGEMPPVSFVTADKLLDVPPAEPVLSEVNGKGPAVGAEPAAECRGPVPASTGVGELVLPGGTPITATRGIGLVVIVEPGSIKVTLLEPGETLEIRTSPTKTIKVE